MRRKGDPVPSIEYLRSLYTGAEAPDDEWCAPWSGVWGLRRAGPEAELMPVAQAYLLGCRLKSPPDDPVPRAVALYNCKTVYIVESVA